VSSFVVQLLIPVGAVLATGRFRARDAWIWSWATQMADLDYIGWMLHVELGTPNLHRALFHNVWTLVAIAGAAWWWGWRPWKQRAAGSFNAWVDAQPGWTIVAFYQFCHILLDIIAGGVTLLWPILMMSIVWRPEILLDTSTAFPRPIAEQEAGTFTGPPDVSPIYQWLAPEEMGIAIIYVSALLLTLGVELHRKRRLQRLFVQPARPVRLDPRAVVPPPKR